MSLAERRAKCRALIRKYYADVPTREEVIDETVSALLKPEHRLLDAGSGDTLPLLNRYGPHARFGVGIDVVTPSAKAAPGTAVSVGDLGALPFRGGSFDIVISRSVVEHLVDPERVFGEVARTLKPGGLFVFTTPNWFYYSSLIAWLVPYSWKDYYMHRVFQNDGYDHFPVVYRANSPKALRRVAGRTKLRIRRLTALRHYPYYFVFSPTLFRLGMLYDWTVTKLGLDALQSTWLVVMERE